MSDEHQTRADAGADDDAPDSLDEVLAEALAEEDSRPSFDPSSSYDEGSPSLDDVDIREALRAALRPVEDISITEKVQKKLREDPELEGQYYTDGWSTAKAPKETYLVTSIVMLIVVIVIYLLIRPYGM